jgi:hypothetical protein
LFGNSVVIVNFCERLDGRLKGVLSGQEGLPDQPVGQGRLKAIVRVGDPSIPFTSGQRTTRPRTPGLSLVLVNLFRTASLGGFGRDDRCFLFE